MSEETIGLLEATPPPVTGGDGAIDVSFPDEERELWPLEGLSDSMGVTTALSLIKQTEVEIDQTEQQAEEAAAFYSKRVETLRSNIGFLKGKIDECLQRRGLKKMATPKGTVYYATRRKVIWPDERTLIEWIKNQPAAVQETLLKVETVETPRKKSLANYIAASQNAPLGFEVSEETKLMIRA